MLRHTARHWHKVTPEDGPLPDAAVELIYDALEDKAREGLRLLMGPAWAYRVMRVERDMWIEDGRQVFQVEASWGR